MIYAIISVSAAVVGFALGSAIGYSTGKDDGFAEAADYYNRRRK